jgi:hypothetical protein
MVMTKTVNGITIEVEWLCRRHAVNGITIKYNAIAPALNIIGITILFGCMVMPWMVGVEMIC